MIPMKRSYKRIKKAFVSHPVLSNKILVLSFVGVLGIVVANSASAALGGPSVMSLLTSKGQTTSKTATVDKQAIVSPSTSPSPKPSPTPSPTTPPQGTTVNGQTYGQHVANEPTATTFSTKPLILSVSSVSLMSGGYSGNVTASSPDGSQLCPVSSQTSNFSAVYNSPACGSTQVFRIGSAYTVPSGTYTSTRICFHSKPSALRRLPNGDCDSDNSDCFGPSVFIFTQRSQRNSDRERSQCYRGCSATGPNYLCW
jgi:hypothetical protein